MDEIVSCEIVYKRRHPEWAYRHRKPVQFMGDMLDSYALAKPVILRAATL